jgi:VWFA-related protein
LRGYRRSLRLLPSTLAFASCLCMTAITLRAQVQKPPTGQKIKQAGKPIRVTVGLVQTDVMVFDRQGHFVPDLKKDQFELRVDGKVQPVEFIELVSAGSSHDREIWAKMEGQPVPDPEQPAAKDTHQGRTLLIFLDDWHMAADNTMRARTAVTNLLNTSMSSNDRVGIFSASGQLAAMQLLTNDKAALLASLEKYNFQSPGVQDMGSPPMTEAQALSIEQRDDNVLSYFIGAILRVPVEYQMGRCKQLSGGMSADFDGNCARAADQTRRRAAALAETSAAIGSRTLSALRQLLRSAEGLPGRKLVFFLSDGFVLQYTRSDIVARLTDLTTAAARAGILVYTLDSRGLVTGTPDAKTSGAPDRTGARMSMAANEVSASWDVLNALAADTGGRFLKNTNALDTALITTLSEISRYYLLAWSIDPEKLPPGKNSKIKASVKGRSDLNVRVRQGSLDLSKLVQAKK